LHVPVFSRYLGASRERKGRALKAVCAWCGRDLGKGAGDDTAAFITHGICDDCAAFFSTSEPETLRELLERFDAPVLLVGVDGVVLTANAAARRAVGKELEEVEGFRGGEVMDCAYARLPGGCGRTEHCAACQIRFSVTETYRTGQSLREVRAYLDIDTPGGLRRRYLLITTERRNDCVLLRLDSLEAGRN
jgi:PAS domain-containing protein